MKCTVLSVAAGLIAVALALPPAAAAHGRERGQAKKPDKVEKKADKVEKKADKAESKADKAEAKPAKHGDDTRPEFDRDGHVRAIQDYRRDGLPPGLAMRQSLPPGLAKQLRERGELPPGLEKRWVGVPGNLSARLPPIPPYYHRYFAGDDLVVVDTRTNRIAWLIRDILR
jgi:hypothetical protein